MCRLGLSYLAVGAWAMWVLSVPGAAQIASENLPAAQVFRENLKLAQLPDEDRLRRLFEQFRPNRDDEEIRDEQPREDDRDEPVNRDNDIRDDRRTGRQPEERRARPVTPNVQPPRRGVQARQNRQVQPGRSVRQETLTRHNALRARHCVPALTWSNRLAGIAQDWANRCQFEHRQSNLGENLAIGTSGAFPPASQVQSWYDEINSYDFATGRSRDGQAVGHFTQVIWRGTRQVGCAVATCNGNDLLVCNYSPAGNVVGRYVQYVPRPCR